MSERGEEKGNKSARLSFERMACVCDSLPGSAGALAGFFLPWSFFHWQRRGVKTAVSQGQTDRQTDREGERERERERANRYVDYTTRGPAGAGEID